MEIRQVKAKNGWQWIISGFYQFRSTPLGWIVLTATLLLIAITLALVPLLGQFIFTLISPVFLAGLMMGCRDMEQGKQLRLSHLFAAFKSNVTPLITIGGIYLVGQVLIVGVVMMIGGSVMTDMMLQGTRVDERELTAVMGSVLTAALVALALFTVLMMAVWFSPLLVVFHKMPPILAMKRSFFACLRNIIPFQLYGITLIVLAVLAALPYGVGLIILIPVIFTSVYASYKDIFLSETIIIKDAQATAISTEEVVSNDDGEKFATPDMDTVKCAHCNTAISKAHAVSYEENYFCNEEHKQQYQSSVKNSEK